ncbi:MAG: type VI secretion system accessory protein TagJ [Phycisphaerales bacterium]
MPAAEQALRDGNLDEALSALSAQVRDNPSNVELRTFLFQVLAVRGDWERALTQLNVNAELDDITLAMVQTYREAIRCELLRKAVFAGERTPVITGEPPVWIAPLLEALRLSAQGNHAAAQQLREAAFEQAETISGNIDDQPFQWIADADTRLGPVLEVIINGRYSWLPFERLARIDIEKPSDLRDVVWMPAHLQLANGGETVALIPTRYPGSEMHENDAIRLARLTEWNEVAAGAYEGAGQRIFATDQDEHAIMDVRRITLDHPADDAEGAEPNG